MRVDRASPRTLLLATVACWTLLVWFDGAVCIGATSRRADDASLAQRLPTPPKPPAERIGTLAQYSETSGRPLFSEDRRPQPFSLQPEGETPQEPSFDFILTSVLQTPGLQMAIVQATDGGASVRMKLGEAPEEAKGWRLVELHPRSAVFDGPEGQKSLELRTFDATVLKPHGLPSPGTAVLRRDMPVPPRLSIKRNQRPVRLTLRETPVASTGPRQQFYATGRRDHARGQIERSHAHELAARSALAGAPTDSRRRNQNRERTPTFQQQPAVQKQ